VREREREIHLPDDPHHEQLLEAGQFAVPWFRQIYMSGVERVVDIMPGL
jgi:hypothetical protein